MAPRLRPRPSKLPPQPSLAAELEAHVAAAPSEDVTGSDDDDEVKERRKLAVLLPKVEDSAVRGFRRLVATCHRSGITEVIVTDHPSYGLSLGVSAHNGPKRAKVDSVELAGGTKCDVDFVYADVTWPWFVKMWARAEGPASGVRCIVFANGLGDMLDLTTGEAPPDDSITIPGFFEDDD